MAQRSISGPWKIPRADDPRHSVIVAPVEGKTLVYWGTPRVKATVEPTAWPQVYRERSERQENSFKRMIDHGALNTNYGRKKIIGADRHQQRVREQLDQALETAQKRVDKQGKEVKTQQAKVVESASKGHGKRLEQRLAHLGRVGKGAQRRATQTQPTRCASCCRGTTWGAGGSRFPQTDDHDGPTLLLENALMSFMAGLLVFLKTKVSLHCLLKLLFERSGTRMETATQVVYWINTAGLSVPYHRLLAEVVERLCAMDLRDQGKPIHVRLKTMPP